MKALTLAISSKLSIDKTSSSKTIENNGPELSRDRVQNPIRFRYANPGHAIMFSRRDLVIHTNSYKFRNAKTSCLDFVRVRINGVVRKVMDTNSALFRTLTSHNADLLEEEAGHINRLCNFINLNRLINLFNVVSFYQVLVKWNSYSLIVLPLQFLSHKDKLFLLFRTSLYVVLITF